jgi:hypothetical protein
VEDLRAFFAEESPIEADAIAAQQLHALKQHYNGKLKLNDMKEMFLHRAPTEAASHLGGCNSP